MPAFYPEDNVALLEDDERRSLIKWNSLLFALAQPAIDFYPEAAEPQLTDDSHRALVKINAIVAATEGGAGPVFYPEGGTPLQTDDPRRSLVKIASLLGITVLQNDDKTRLLQLIVTAYAGGTGPAFYPEGGESRTSDSAQRSLVKIVALANSGALGPSAPVVDGGLTMTLQADDATWHRFGVRGESPNAHTYIEQEAVADPGTRGYVVLESGAGGLHYKLAFRKSGTDYVFKQPELTAEAADFVYAFPLLLASNDDLYLYRVQFATTEGDTRLRVDQAGI